MGVNNSKRSSQVYPLLRGCCRFFLSGPSSYGEGELKLADWINVASDKSRTQNAGHSGLEPSHDQPSDSIVIIGGDADLVVQCLALPYASNLFVYNPQAVTKSKTSRGTTPM